MYDSYYVIVRNGDKIGDLSPSLAYDFTVNIPNNFTQRFPNNGDCYVELCNVLLHRDASGTLVNGYINIEADFKQENVYETTPSGTNRTIALFATPQDWAVSTTIDYAPQNPIKIKTSFPLSFVSFKIFAYDNTGKNFENEIDVSTFVLKFTPIKK